MNILISGGTGLVGTEIGKKLAGKGHKLFILTRSKEKAAKQCPFPNTPVSWDELESSNIGADLEGIINLAGTNIFENRWNSEVKKKIHQSRIESTRTLVNFANQKCKNLKSFVSTSAVGIYGEADEQMVTEENSLSYSFLGQVCQDWEAEAKNLKVGNLSIVRVGIAFSEKGGALEEMVPPIQAGVGGALGDGKAYMSWIDIDDLSDIFIHCLENSLTGTYNATAPNPATNQEISKEIANHLGTSLLMNVPFFALRMVVGPVAKHLVESQTISSEKIQKTGFKFKYTNIKDSIKTRVPKLKGTQRRYIFEQWVPQSKEEIFPFFSEAKNLERITPDSLSFHIVSVSTDEIQEGTEINYRLKVDGIPLKWKTIIQQWDPPHQFVDNQEKGPYRKWHHTHRFEELAGGTLMTDQVDFELPLGALGYMAAGWKVLKDVNNIFEFRREKIYDLYVKDKNQSR